LRISRALLRNLSDQTAHNLFVQLIRRNRGLFCRNMGLFCGYLGHFSGNIRLFCRKIGSFADIEGFLRISVALWWNRSHQTAHDLLVELVHRNTGLFCRNIRLFCEYLWLFCRNMGLFCEYPGLFSGTCPIQLRTTCSLSGLCRRRLSKR